MWASTRNTNQKYMWNWSNLVMLSWKEACMYWCFLWFVVVFENCFWCGRKFVALCFKLFFTNVFKIQNPIFGILVFIQIVIYQVINQVSKNLKIWNLQWYQTIERIRNATIWIIYFCYPCVVNSSYQMNHEWYFFNPSLRGTFSSTFLFFDLIVYVIRPVTYILRNSSIEISNLEEASRQTFCKLTSQ